MRYQTIKNRLTAVFLTTCLIAGSISSIPVPAYADEEDTISEAASEGGTFKERDIDAEVAELLSAGEYEEGSVIVLYDREYPVYADEELVGASALLGSAEQIADISAESYVNATGDTLEIPEELVGASEYKGSNDRVALVAVEDDTKSTEELLRELLSDPRVLTAEPDYIIDVTDMNDDALEEAAEEALYSPEADLADAGEEDIFTDLAEDVPDTAEEEDEAAEEDESVPDSADMAAEEYLPPADAVDPAAAPEAADDLVTVPVPADESVAEEAEITIPVETLVGASMDLTPYQWGMSDGSNRYSQSARGNADVYGINIPNWNTPGMENAEGVVAVVDTGVDYTHPDLADNMYVFSPEEQSALGCGKYGISTVPGVRDTKDTMDIYGHGTHCAGIIAASWNNVGISGVASGSRVMAVRSLNDSGRASYKMLLNGLAFVENAKKYGIDIRVASNSYGSNVLNYAMRVLVTELGKLGVVCVFSSGNEDRHVDTQTIFTDTIWDLPNIIIVNASQEDGEAASFTNFSQNATHVFAPGVGILSTIPDTDSPIAQRSYFTEMDPSPIYADPGWTNLSDELFGTVQMSWMDAPYRNYFSYSRDYENTSNGTAPSVKITLQKDIPEGRNFSICLLLPVTEETVIGNASLDLFVPDRNIQARLRMQDNGDGDRLYREFIPEDAASDWINCSVTGLDKDDVKLEFGGRYYAPVYIDIFAKEGGSLKAGQYIYIDNPALGSAAYNTPSTLYTFMDGTSMAAPAVAGAAMIQYKGRSVSKETAEDITANLKSQVRKKDSLSRFCTSGGVLDLSVSGDMMLPVINTAVLNAADRSLTLTGYHFASRGNASRVALAGTELEITNWSDNSITVKCPDSMASGLQKITVTTAAGLSSCGAFSITVPSSAGIKDSALPLYEKTLADIPSDLVTVNEMLVQASALDDYIYVTVAKLYTNSNFCEKLIRYSIKKDSWELVDDIPFNGLSFCSMTAFEGCIFLSGIDEKNAAHLIRYVPATGKWLETTGCGADGSTLVNYKNNLLYVGGYSKEYGNTIRKIDMPNNKLIVIESLPDICAEPNAAVLDNTLYIYGGTIYDEKTDAFTVESGTLLCYTQSGSTLKRDTSREINLGDYKAPSYNRLYGAIGASDRNVYLVGAYMKGNGSEAEKDPTGFSVADGDTWTLNGAPENINKRLSHTITYLPVVTVYKGVLYGFGLNSLDGDATSYVLRATEVDKNPKTPIQDTITVKIPKAVKGLIYNGKAQTGVPASPDGSYTIKDNKKTAAGTYKAVLELVDPEWYVWEDGTRTTKTITWSIAKKTVNVKSVKLDKSNLTLYVGQTGQLKATVSPSNADNKKVTWKSSNTKIATVDKNGKVTAKAAGTVKVTVQTADGKKTATCTVKVLKGVPVYRLYNKKGNGDHLFTTSLGEKNKLLLHGWVYEGVAWNAPVKSSIPVYRFYNRTSGNHMYTSSATERKALVGQGWVQEGIAFYAATSADKKPVYRLYNPNNGQHFFTASAGERDTLKKAGWKYEGVGFQTIK